MATVAPEAVFSRLQKVWEWPRMFADIKKMRIAERGSNRFRIELETRTLDCGTHAYEVRIEPPRSIRLWIDAPGITALASMRVLDGSTARHSWIVYSLFVEAHGIASWFVSTDALRRKQENMVVQYLGDLKRLFGTQAIAAVERGGTASAARTANTIVNTGARHEPRAR